MDRIFPASGAEQRGAVVTQFVTQDATEAVPDLRKRPLTCVGVAGFEPTTSSSRTKRAAKLRYTPRRAEQS